MPTLKLYQNGLSASMGGTGEHLRALRGEIKGWTAATARRHTQWLWQVRSDDLSGSGFAVTLTMRDTPPTAEEFHRMRKALLMRWKRMGASRIHWVIEWQARGTPHIHAAVYFEGEGIGALPRHAMLAVQWLEVCDAFGYEASWKSQDCKAIDGPLGWLKYLAKHASRGAAHYQRRGHPEGWDKTGRMWGHAGDWPVSEPVELDGLNNREFWRLRRLVRNWSRNQAAAAGDWDRLRYLRSAGRPDNAHQSRFMGVSEWIPESVSLRLVDFFERE